MNKTDCLGHVGPLKASLEQVEPGAWKAAELGMVLLFFHCSLLGFGTPASSSSNLFGASTPGAFGAATPSSGGLFGASSGGLFGSSSTPSLFGGQSSGGNLFGSPSPSLFGSASTAGQSGGLFGFGANSSPSLFGAQSSAAAVQVTSYIFNFGWVLPNCASMPLLLAIVALLGVIHGSSSQETHIRTSVTLVSPATIHKRPWLVSSLMNLEDELRGLEERVI